MYFNDTSNTSNSLYHYSIFLTGLPSTDTTSFPVADFTRSLNSWYRRLVFLMWKSAYGLEFDDSNFSTLPIATATMVAGQQDYTLPTTALDIQRVEVLDVSGDWQLVEAIDKADITDEALTEFEETSGLPLYYDLIGGSIMLYPKPGSGYVTLTSGLKLYLTRDIDSFETTDTTKDTGIVAFFHPYLAYGPALDYTISKNMDPNRINTLRGEITKYEVAVQEHAARRNAEYKVRLKPKTKSSNT